MQFLVVTWSERIQTTSPVWFVRLEWDRPGFEKSGEDALAYFDEADQIKRDVIAVKQLHALKQLQGPQEKPLRLSDVKKMFVEMRKHLRR